jgi:thiol-disulfide isomerase/thioredoxin
MKITNENKPYLIGMVIIVFLIIGSLFLLVSMIGSTFEVPESEFDQDINTEYSLEDKNESEKIEQETVEECLADFGYTEMIYLYSPSCPACKIMTPTVQELINEGYEIYIADAYQDSNYAKISNCVKDIKGSIPQVICNKNGNAIVGTKNKEKLIEIYNEC